MRFIDQATIDVEAGKGGAGSRHFRREKFVPRGGPDGGDGGRGGDVVLVASDRSRSLLDYHNRRLHKAEAGRPGAGQRSTGRSGASLELVVPVGTQVLDEETGELLSDLVEDGQRVIVAHGGIGGRGNYRFRSATIQAPDRSDPGRIGEARTLLLELKLLADVGLVGLPNAGKSTFIRKISASRARVADYPFTTLVPNLGVVRHRGRVFTVADIPGLVAGAAEGAGLGMHFLRHVQRCRVFVFVLAAQPHDLSELQGEAKGVDDLLEPGTESPAAALDVLRRELAAHDPDLIKRSSVLVLNKCDLLGSQAGPSLQALSTQIAERVYPMSAINGDGVGDVLDALLGLLGDDPIPEEEWDPSA